MRRKRTEEKQPRDPLRVAMDVMVYIALIFFGLAYVFLRWVW